MRIFICDDDKLVLKAISISLKRDNHDISEFTQGADLLTALSGGQMPDLVMTDMYMPGMSGLELLAKIKEKNQDLAVVVMTSSRELDITVKAINLGAYGYLLKPVVFEELRWMISRLAHELKLQERLDEESKKLVHAQRLAELGTLASGIAHEINNPNTFIRGNADVLNRIWEKFFAELFTRPDLADHPLVKMALREVPGVLQGIKDGSDRITKIVRSLGYYSRNEGESKSYTSLRKAIEEATTILSNKLDQAKWSVEDNAPGLDLLAVSEVPLVQVLVNLLANAYDATEGMEPRIIKIKLEPQGNNNIKISVVDYGHGIALEHMDKLISPFFSTKRQGEGTGLGLYITNQLVTRMKGELSYLNNEEGGATFSMVLPLEKTAPVGRTDEVGQGAQR